MSCSSADGFEFEVRLSLSSSPLSSDEEEESDEVDTLRKVEKTYQFCKHINFVSRFLSSYDEAIVVAAFRILESDLVLLLLLLLCCYYRNREKTILKQGQRSFRRETQTFMLCNSLHFLLDIIKEDTLSDRCIQFSHGYFLQW